MCIFPAGKLRNCCVGAVLGLGREIPDLSTLSVLGKGKLANLSSFLSILSKPLLRIDRKSAGLHCKHTASLDQHGLLPKRAEVSQQTGVPGQKYLCRGAGPRRVSAPTAIVGTEMSPGVPLLFRSISCLDTAVLLGPVNQRGSLCFSE